MYALALSMSAAVAAATTGLPYFHLGSLDVGVPIQAFGILVAAGVLIGAATLGLLRLPVVPIAALLSLVGAAFVALQALGHGDFHFFAFTMLVAGLLVAFSARGTRERTTG